MIWIIISLLIIISAMIGQFWSHNQALPSNRDRDRKRKLLLKKVKPKVRYSGGKISVDYKEAYWYNLLDNYILECKFAYANSDKVFDWGGEKISFSSHRNKHTALENIQKMKEKVYNETDIDLDEIIDVKGIKQAHK